MFSVDKNNIITFSCNRSDIAERLLETEKRIEQLITEYEEIHKQGLSEDSVLKRKAEIEKERVDCNLSLSFIKVTLKLMDESMFSVEEFPIKEAYKSCDDIKRL